VEDREGASHRARADDGNHCAILRTASM
jgi:hypothetical protein